MPKLQTAITISRYYSSFLNVDLARSYLCCKNNVKSSALEQVGAAIQWICRAQDAFDDGGVARSYSLIYNPNFKRKGWVPPYPETTGYIIPTMFAYANLSNKDEIFERAVRMTDWECDVQMKNGAVQGGTIDQSPTPAIFNTGQVIFGWARAYQETGKERYLDAAIKAGRYLVEQQDRDGAWRKNLSDYASKEMSFYTYNTRTAWALLVLGTITGNIGFKEAAVRNIDFALGQQRDNGWFRSNCLHDPSQPLLHTIAYCIRGILESGIQLQNQLYINRAGLAADALLKQQRQDGSLPGRFNEKWAPTVTWSCLTGDAQISIIWSRLFQITGRDNYRSGMIRVNKYLRSVQLLKAGNRDVYGGMGGSDPIHGGYGRFEILNWPVKFFIDALMLEISLRKNDS